MRRGALAYIVFGLAIAGRAQSSTPVTTTAVDPAGLQRSQLEQRVESLSSAVTVAQQQMEQSQRQMQQLQQELLQLRQQIAAASGAAPVSANDDAFSAATSSSSLGNQTSSAPPAPLEERQEAVEAAVKLHDQTKVESSSKYPVRVTGLLLFNAFLNKGVPDNTDLPAVATRTTATSGDGSIGASFRQTILGIEGNGPRIAGARTSAKVNFDFFSGVSYTSYGTSAGVVRMRTASIDFDWANDSIQLGMVAPLISPLSPTSYATVGEPSLASAGNLWAWAPQLRYAHQFQLREGNHLQFEFGLWDSAAAGYNFNQLFRTASPAELAEQPAYESRVSYGSQGEGRLQLGIGGYYSRQSYYASPTDKSLDSWTSTLDFRIPFAHRFELSGEGYRGRSLGGLGGGVYKDAILGTDPISGGSKIHGLNAVGGWTQFKTRFIQSMETNFAIGQDNGLARDFHALILPATASASQLRARNRMAVANLIFKPKTYIILSPEYRRIWTWPISGKANTLNVFTLSVGYQF